MMDRFSIACPHGESRSSCAECTKEQYQQYFEDKVPLRNWSEFADLAMDPYFMTAGMQDEGFGMNDGELGKGPLQFSTYAKLKDLPLASVDEQGNVGPNFVFNGDVIGETEDDYIRQCFCIATVGKDAGLPIKVVTESTRIEHDEYITNVWIPEYQRKGQILLPTQWPPSNKVRPIEFRTEWDLPVGYSSRWKDQKAWLKPTLYHFLIVQFLSDPENRKPHHVQKLTKDIVELSRYLADEDVDIVQLLKNGNNLETQTFQNLFKIKF